MINVDEILKQTEKYDVITFDAFDTLIIRDVMKPAHVFRCAYGFWGRYLRVVAEIFARKTSKKTEITLDDIYRFLPFSSNKEIEYEKRLCRANPKIYKLVQMLLNQGKKVYAISDMYLSKDTISEILIASGYDVPVLVSSEYGCNKFDGALFQEFLREYNYRPEQVVHIGDNESADVVGAKKAGISSIRIQKHENELSYVKFGRKNYEYASFINHGICELENPVEKIGYEIVGPIILSFCQWIHDEYIECGFDRLFFLARDMHFVFDIYGRLYDDNISYLCISRKALKYSRSHSEEFIKYLKNNHCYGKVAMVDAGWVGTAQIEIDKYTKQIDSKSDVGGLYLGRNLAFCFRRRSKDSYSCIYSTIPEQFRCELSSAFMESLIGSDEKQVISYEKGLPVFNGDKESYDLSGIKMGAQKFISDWMKYKGNKTIDAKLVRRPFEKLFCNPKKKDINELQNIKYEDDCISEIITYKGKTAYKGDISAWLKDLSHSPWKGGFFYMTFGNCKLPLYLYLFINTFRNIYFDIRHLVNDDLE